MRLPNTAHTSRPWRIHELTRDFRLEDVWELPGRGGPDDFSRLVELIASMDPSKGSSRAARALWAIRWKLGELLGWDDPDAGLGSRVPTLRDRLPVDLRDAPPGPEFDSLPFTPLYLTESEFAAEIANRTMHGVMHIGRVPDGSGGYRAQMAVLVKPNGLFGAAYMAAIRPFRHLIVYPAVMRDRRDLWERARSDTSARLARRGTAEAPDAEAVVEEGLTGQRHRVWSATRPAPFVYIQRVRPQECAASTMLGHPRFLEFFEAAFIECWRDRFGQLDASLGPDRRLTVAAVNVRYLAPVRADDELRIEVVLGRITERSIQVHYDAFVEDARVAEGGSRYVCLDAESGHPASLPDAIASH